MHCGYCEWRCDLDEQRYGVCQMYCADGRHRGALSQPLEHVCDLPHGVDALLPRHPGSRTMTIGTMSCNFRCRYCSNAHVALSDPGQQARRCTS